MLYFSYNVDFFFWIKKTKLGEEGQAEQTKTLKMCVCVCVCVCEIHISVHWSLVHCSKCYTFPPPLYTAIIFLSIAAKLGFHTGNKNGCEIELMLRLKGNSLFFLFRELKLERKAPPCFPVHLKPSPTYLLVKNRVIGSGSEPGNFSVLALA